MLRNMDRGRIALLLTLAGFVALVGLALRWYLDQDTVPLFDAASWHLGDDNAGMILWQKDLSCLEDSRVPHGALAVVGNQVVFHQDCLPGIAVLKAVNVVTGEQVWWAKASSSSQLVAVADGVVNVEDATRLVKYDLTGHEVWRSADFPPQSISSVYLREDQLYVMYAAGLRIVSLQTGQGSETTTEGPVLQSFADGFLLLHDSGIEVVFQRGAPVMIDLPQIGRVPRESIWFDVHAPMLYLSMEAGVVYAYDLATGARLWTIETQALSSPLVSEKRLFLYTSANTLDTYDLQTGQRVNSVVLERTGGYSGSADLASADGTMVLAFPQSHEIIALTLQ